MFLTFFDVHKTDRCGHCKALAPTWNELGDAYAGSSSVIIGDVDCTVEESICSNFEVRGYPTLKYFTAETGAKGEDYNSGRDIDALKAFVEETLAIKCQLNDQEKCSQKEKDYMAKMQGASKEEVTAAHERLEKMKGGSMKPELKQWLVQRLSILTQIKEA